LQRTAQPQRRLVDEEKDEDAQDDREQHEAGGRDGKRRQDAGNVGSLPER
tara:strand:+ start:503 stop:652 length:150 start_codon:yes stop_codon:yes gene_type:complete